MPETTRPSIGFLRSDRSRWLRIAELASHARGRTFKHDKQPEGHHIEIELPHGR